MIRSNYKKRKVGKIVLEPRKLWFFYSVKAVDAFHRVRAFFTMAPFTMHGPFSVFTIVPYSKLVKIRGDAPGVSKESLSLPGLKALAFDWLPGAWSAHETVKWLGGTGDHPLKLESQGLSNKGAMAMLFRHNTFMWGSVKTSSNLAVCKPTAAIMTSGTNLAQPPFWRIEVHVYVDFIAFFFLCIPWRSSIVCGFLTISMSVLIFVMAHRLKRVWEL